LELFLQILLPADERNCHQSSGYKVEHGLQHVSSI
jgi:hypothetical protein